MSDSGKFEPNDDYLRYCPRWTKVDDIVDGGARLKEKDLARNGTYLRQLGVNPDQPFQQNTQYNCKRNINYINGAILVNATERTLTGLMGMLFRVAPSDENIVGDIEYLIQNVNGAGLTLNHQAKSTASKVLQQGRRGLLVDMPKTDGVTEITRADVANGFRPKILTYEACEIVDWNESLINNQMVLDLVVLNEVKCIFIDDQRIKRKKVLLQRVLRLLDGVYVQETFIEGESQGDFTIITDGNNIPMSFIPFIFVGSVNNDPCIDMLPLESIADVNLGQYRNSADLESSSFQLSAAQPWIADDHYAHQISNPNEKGELTQTFGEEDLIVLGNGGSFNISQPDPNTLANDLAKEKRIEMAELGAQLISEGGAAETAEAARIKKASDASVLDIISENISSAYSQCISWCGLFLGVDLDAEEIGYKLNDDFFETKLTPEERNIAIMEMQSGIYPTRIARSLLQKGGVIPANEDLIKLDEEVKAEVDIMPDLDDSGLGGANGNT